MEYRIYQPNDAPAIQNLFTSVFTESEGEEEGKLVGGVARELMASTDAGDLFGFVAVEGERIVGAILFSRLTFEQEIEVFLLAPVAVDSDQQSKGIGQALIRHGLGEMKASGTSYVITYGDPAFYSKVGFHPISQDAFMPPYELSQPIGWIGQSLTDETIDAIPGRSKCVKAFGDPALW